MKDPVSVSMPTSDCCYVMDDNSMEQMNIFPGDLVYIRKCSKPEPGKLMAVNIAGGVELRYIQITPAGVMFIPGGLIKPL